MMSHLWTRETSVQHNFDARKQPLIVKIVVNGKIMYIVDRISFRLEPCFHYDPTPV